MQSKNFKNLSKLVSGVFVIFVGILFFIFILLTIKPIKISSLNFEKSSLLKDYQLNNLGEVYLSFNKFSKNFELLIEDIETNDLKIPNVLLGISIKNILLFNIKPTILKIYDAELSFDIDSPNLNSFYTLDKKESLKKLIKNKVNNNIVFNYFDHFKIFELNNTKVEINNVLKRNIIIPRVDLKIEKRNDDFVFSGYVEIDKESDSVVTFGLRKKNSGYLSNIIFEKFNFELDDQILNYISVLGGQFNLDGELSIIFDNNYNIADVNSELQFDAKLLKKINNNITTLALKQGKININTDESGDIIESNTKFNLNGSNVDLSYLIDIDSSNINLINFNIFIDSIKINLVKKLWPLEKKDAVFNWVNENAEGNLSDLEINLLFEEKTNTVDSYNLNFNFFDSIIKYSENMPNIYKLNGNANFDGNNFIFIINSGESEALKLNNGKVLLYDFNKDIEKAKINLSLDGLTQDITKYLKNTSLNPDSYMRLEKFTGKPNLNLELKFPLLLDLKFEEIDYKGYLSFKNSKIYDVFNGFDLKKIDMTIDISDQLVTYNGQGYIEKMLVKIEGNETHNNSKKLNELKIALDFDPDYINNYLPEFLKDINGKIPLDIFYKYNMNNDIYEIVANGKTKFFTAYSPLLGLDHNYDDGDISFKINSDIKKNEMIEFLFDSKKLNIFVEFFTKDRKINEIVIHRINSPLQDFNALISKKGNIWNTIIKGEKINFKKYFENINDSNEDKDFKYNLKFKLDINEIIFKKKSIKSPILNGFLLNGKFEEFEFRYNNDVNEHLIKIDNKVKKKEFLVKSNDASELFDIFDLHPNTKGGLLDIKGYKDYHDPEYSGNIMLKNFVAYDTPFFTKVLTLFSLDGLEQKLKGGGIYFDTLQSKYKFKNHSLQIQDGFVRGSDLGLTFQGEMDVNKKDFDIDGTLIPAYTINTLLTSLPIVGDIITAGAPEEGILAATFNMKKNNEILNISFNPISVLVPSIIRNFLKQD